MSVAVQLSPEALALITRLERFPTALAQRVSAALDYENEITIGAIQRLRLSQRGPETLGVVTNRLRSSVSRAPARLAADGRTIISSIGSNVAYAGAHEYGFRGAVQVPAHQRRRFALRQVGGNAYLDPVTGRIRKTRKKQERTLTGTVTVRAHERQLNIKARAPFRRGIEARASAYGTALSRAITSALHSA